MCTCIVQVESLSDTKGEKLSMNIELDEHKKQ